MGATAAAAMHDGQPTLDGRTVVLADTHPLWLETVSSLVERMGLRVVGTASTIDATLELVAREQPDVLISEIRLRGHAGETLSWLARARASAPNLKAIILSSLDSEQHVESAFEAGAIAYVVKTANREDLVSVIRQAFDHSVYIGRIAPPIDSRPPQLEADSPGLTKRELEILRLVAEGYSNSELARMLWVTEQTVKFHLSNVYRKLDVPNRTAASRWAQAHGVLAEADSAEAGAA